MAKDDVSVEDLQATASAKFDETKDAVLQASESFVKKLTSLDLNQKLLLTGAAALVASVAIQKVAQIIRDRNVAEIELVVVDSDDILD